MFLIYGKGGTGKSDVVKIMAEVVGHQVCNLSNLFILQNPKSFKLLDLTSKALLEAASARLVLFSYFETSTDKYEFIIRTVKSLTGEDVRADISVSVTTVATTNNMPDNRHTAKYMKPIRICRLDIVPTVLKRRSQDISFLPLDPKGISQLAYVPMVTRIKYDKPPFTLVSLLYTLFLKRAGEVLNIVEQCDGASRM